MHTLVSKGGEVMWSKVDGFCARVVDIVRLTRGENCWTVDGGREQTVAVKGFSFVGCFVQ